MFKGLKMNLQLMADAGAGGGTPNQTDGGTNTDTELVKALMQEQQKIIHLHLTMY